MSVKTATKQVIESFEDVLEDDDEGPLVYLALAVLQLEKGSIQKDIREKVLEIIESEQGLDRWKESGEESLAKRKSILNQLKINLME